MAEQKATARFLLQEEVIAGYFTHFRHELNDRLSTIYRGIMALKAKGYNIDCIAPQAAIYLTVKLDLKGQSADGRVLHDQKEVTDYILAKAKLAIVPFYAFGAGDHSPWYRLSVGTCVRSEIPEMLALLEQALHDLQ